MSAREFLDRLEKDELLEDAVIADLRRQLREASRGVTAESLAKLLVDSGHLTRFQASKLIKEVTAEIEEKKGQRAETAEARRVEAERQSAQRSRSLEDDLLLAPPPVPPSPAAQSPAAPAKPGSPSAPTKPGAASRPARPAPPPPARPASPAAPAEDELILLDTPETKPAKPAKPKPPSARPKPAKPAPLPPLAEAPPDDLVVIEEGPGLSSMDAPGAGRSGAASMDAAVEADQLGGAIATADPFMTATAPSALTTAKKKRTRDNPWDSPLMLVGGGALVLLAILSFVLYRSMTRGTAQEIFAAAEEDYRNGAYTNAVQKYEQMLESFPRDEDAGKARVKVQMARLRLVAGGRDPSRALKTAQEILPTIEKEPEFQSVREELATLLPDIAKAFADRARQAQSADEAEKLLASVNESMALVENPAYIPTSLRKTLSGVISRVEETSALVRRDIGRDRELGTVVAAMSKAIGDGNPREAYQLRDSLVAKYPVLERHPQILAKIGEVSELERDLVKVEQNTVEGIAEDAVPSGNSVVVSTRSGEPIPGVTDQIAVVLARGSVYGLDAGTGQVLWRRFVGHDAISIPQALSNEPNADLIVGQAADQEVMRVEARTGNVLWRVPIGEAFYGPVVWREQVVVTTHTGRVWSIDAATGRSSRQTNLAQNLPSAVGADSKTAQLYQVGENDNLYVLSPESMECREVVYLGHRPGTIAVPPTPAVGMLFVAINAGPDFSFVHPLAMNEEGLGLAPAQDPIRLAGHVIRPPVVLGRRLIYTTTLGAIHVLDVNPQEKRPVAEDIKPTPATRSNAVISYAAADQGKLWIADQRLMLYEIQASQGQLSRRWIEYDGDTFVGPLQRFGPALVQVRRAASAPGFRVAAINADDPKTVYWQTDVAAPVLEMFASDAGVSAVTSRGSVITASAETLEQGFVEAAGDSRVSNLIFATALPLGDGRHVIFSDASRVLVYDPAQSSKELRLIRVNVPERSAATKPIIVNGGLLLPLRTGSIALLDMMTGDNQVLPFQPPLEAGKTVQWQRPAALSGGKEFVVADDQQHLYRVGIVNTGRPHLEALETVATEELPVTGLAVHGEFAWAGVRRSDTDVLVGYRLPRLKAEATLPLKGRILWGPETLGDALFVATDSEGLVCVDANGQQRWAAALPEGGLAGVAPENGDFIVAAANGSVLRIAGADGRELGRHEVDEPLASGPVLAGTDWWVSTFDGTLHRIPQLAAAQP